MHRSNKIKNISLSILAAAFSYSLSASASVIGGSDGGGGVGVRCLDSTGKTTSFELLDLYEARQRHLTISHSPNNAKEATDLVTDLIFPHFWNPDTIPVSEIKKNTYEPFLNIFKGTPSKAPNSIQTNVEFGADLPLSSDIGHYNIPAQCRLEQIAYFSDIQNTLHISQSHWNELNWLNRSALLAHELVYMLERQDGLENFGKGGGKMTSELSRFFVGSLFSTNPIPPKSTTIPLNRYFVCGDSPRNHNHVTYFYAFDENKSLSAVFNVIQGWGSVYQLKAHFSGADVEELTDTEQGEFNETVPLTFAGQANASSFEIQIKKVKGENPHFQAFQILNSRRVPVFQEQTLACNEEIYNSNPAPSQPAPQPVDITIDFLKTYIGKFVDEYKESYLIQSSGAVQNLQTRQVGAASNSRVPYPTVCSYIQTGKISSVVQRDPIDRKDYIDFATHIIEVEYSDISLTDVPGEEPTTTNPNCQAFLREKKASLAKNPIAYSLYSELLGPNSFRLQTSGGGDYQQGGPRTPSTLDEVYVRVH